MRFYTYILYSPNRYQYYVGHCSESLEHVLYEHNTGKRICTKNGIPWKLVYSKKFDNCCESYMLMQKLQNMKSRKYLQYFIDQLIQNENNQTA
jgi:hypothetical protein